MIEDTNGSYRHILKYTGIFGGVQGLNVLIGLVRTKLVAILLGHFGPKLRITTYTALSANLMIREIGISLFMAAVGLGAGKTFVSSLVGGGYMWVLYGALITVIPMTVATIGSIVARIPALLASTVRRPSV